MPLKQTYQVGEMVDIYGSAEKVEIIQFTRFEKSTQEAHWQHDLEIYLVYYQPFDIYENWAWCQDCQCFIFLRTVESPK